jgi:hypothetical protein
MSIITESVTLDETGRVIIKFSINTEPVIITQDEVDSRAARFAEAATRWAEIKATKDQLVEDLNG